MGYYKDCYGENKNDEKWRPPYPPKPERFPVSVLSCGNGQGASIPLGGIGVIDGMAARTLSVSDGGSGLILGSVTLDTNGLDHPDIKIDFSSLINFRANFLSGYTLRLVFQLSRCCNNGAKTALATWTYAKEADVFLDGLSVPTDVSGVFDFSDPFGFFWCQCNSCPGCCLYTVEVVDVFAYGIECASITNVGITAIASGKPE
ncbi:MAG: DUF4489 domain-containing protein [Syntrophomonadaceae bacterium]|nr:DUF4489 domain-containing protein [Syntrophomonadaceae bacterium]